MNRELLDLRGLCCRLTVMSIWWAIRPCHSIPSSRGLTMLGSLQLLLSLFLGLASALVSLKFEDELTSPLGLLLMLLGPLTVGFAVSSPRFKRFGARNGFAFAAPAAFILGSANASRGEEGGALVLFGTTFALLLAMSVPILMFKATMALWRQP